MKQTGTQRPRPIGWMASTCRYTIGGAVAVLVATAIAAPDRVFVAVDPLVLVLAAAVGALVAGLVGLAIACQRSASIAALTQAVEAFAAGDDAPSLTLDGASDVSRLAEAFTLMRDHLAARTAEREIAEAALIASEERFRHLAEQAPDVVMRRELYPTDRYTFVSPSITRILGYTPEDYYADVRFSGTLAYQGDTFTSYATDACDRPNELEVHRLRHKDGHWVWIETRRNCIYDERGELTGYEAICRDVTERVEHAEAIAQSETRLRMALEAAQMSFWEIDPATLRMWRSNHAATLAGTATADDLGQTLDEVLTRTHPDDRDRVRSNLLSAMNDGSMVEHTWRIIWPDGTIRWMESQGRTMRRADGSIRLFGTTKDITARKAAVPAGRRTPIIALTANALDGARDACLLAGMDDYVTKPTTMAAVAAALNRWLPPTQSDGATSPHDGPLREPISSAS
jgi:PAS domain S-box-containing protein